MNDIESNEDERIDRLTVAIKRAFPDEAFSGRITPVDERWTPEVDDSEALYKALKGQKWTDVSRELIRYLPDGFVLLSDEAFVQFIAAWILEALKDTSIESGIRDALVFSFESSKRQVVLLNKEQRATLGCVLEQIARVHPSEFVRERALRAVANVV